MPPVIPTPPGKPWIEGDGANTPYVLKWQGVETGLGRVVGYAIEVRVYGAGGDGNFKQLTANSGSKATRYGLANMDMQPGAAYAFRVAALVQTGAGAQQQGGYGDASAPLECEHVRAKGQSSSSGLQKQSSRPEARVSSASRGRSGRNFSDDVEPDPDLVVSSANLGRASSANAGGTSYQGNRSVGDVKREMEAWEQRWADAHDGARPSVQDKVSSKEYQELARMHKQLRRSEKTAAEQPTGGGGGGEEVGGGGGGGGGGGSSSFKKSEGRSGGESSRGGHGGSSRRGKSGGEGRSRDREGRSRGEGRSRNRDRGGGGGGGGGEGSGAADVSTLRDEELKLSKGLERWEAEYEKKHGKKPRSGDRSDSRYYSETYKKRAEIRAKISRLEAGGGGGGAEPSGKSGKSGRSSRSGKSSRSTAEAAAPTAAEVAAEVSGIDASKDAAPPNAASSVASKMYAEQLAAKAGGELPPEVGKMSDNALGQAVELFKKYDSDGDGVLGYSEFYALMTELAKLAGRKHDPVSLRAVFHQLDVDNSRELDFIEFVQLAATGFSAAPVKGVRRQTRKVSAEDEAAMEEAFDEVSEWQPEATHKPPPKNDEERMIQEWAAEFAQDGLTVAEVRRGSQLFRERDHDRRGAISPRSFFEVMKSIGAAQGQEFSLSELQGMLRRADSDADGDVDFYELLQLLARQKRLQAAKEEDVNERQLRMAMQAQARESSAVRLQTEKEERAREEERRQEEMAKLTDEMNAAAARAALLSEEEAEEAAAEAAALAAAGLAAEEAAAQAAAHVAEAHGHPVGSHAAMQAESRVSAMDTLHDQYHSMLLEQLYIEEVLEHHPHLAEGMIECAVKFYESFDVNRNGMLDKDDFVKGMKAYARTPEAKAHAGEEKAATLIKRAHLEVEFSKADANHDQQLTICEFVRYLGRDKTVNVLPEALAAACGYELPPGMHYLHHEGDEEELPEDLTRKPTKGRVSSAMATRQANFNKRKQNEAAEAAAAQAQAQAQAAAAQKQQELSRISFATKQAMQAQIPPGLTPPQQQQFMMQQAMAQMPPNLTPEQQQQFMMMTQQQVMMQMQQQQGQQQGQPGQPAQKKKGFMSRMMSSATSAAYKAVDDIEHMVEGDQMNYMVEAAAAHTAKGRAPGKASFTGSEASSGTQAGRKGSGHPGVSFAQAQLKQDGTKVEAEQSFAKLHPGARASGRGNFMKTSGIDAKQMAAGGKRNAKLNAMEGKMAGGAAKMAGKAGTSKFNGALNFMAAF